MKTIYRYIIVSLTALGVLLVWACDGGNQKSLEKRIDSLEQALNSQNAVGLQDVSDTVPKPVMKFEELTYNFKEIKQGDKVTHVFKFTNAGNADLVIYQASPSCGCTVPSFPKEPIKPGEGGEISVVFDSKGKSGQQQKTVTVSSNAKPAQVTLEFTGVVVE